jgi:hypothetical protein
LAKLSRFQKKINSKILKKKLESGFFGFSKNPKKKFPKKNSQKFPNSQIPKKIPKKFPPKKSPIC